MQEEGAITHGHQVFPALLVHALAQPLGIGRGARGDQTLEQGVGGPVERRGRQRDDEVGFWKEIREPRRCAGD